MLRPPRAPAMRRLVFAVLFGVGMALLTFNLGQWQSGRAEQKQALHNRQVAALEAAPITPQQPTVDLDNLSYRKVSLKGRFIPGALVYIDNRQVNARPAVQVVQAFQPEGAEHVVPVDRGFLLRSPSQPREAPPMPGQEVDPAGHGEPLVLLATLLPRFAQSAELRGLGLGAEGQVHTHQSNGVSVWSNFDVDLFGQWVGLPVSNYVLTQQPVLVQAPAGAAGTPPVQALAGFYHVAAELPEQVAKHRGYAFQWYSMTVALVLLTGVFVYREFFRGSSS